MSNPHWSIPRLLCSRRLGQTPKKVLAVSAMVDFSLAERKAGQLGALLSSPRFMMNGTVFLVLLVER